MDTRRRQEEALFERHFEQIEQAVATVARRKRLREEEAQELQSQVYLKILRDDYAVLREFEGRSRWSTYLTVIVLRVLLDERVRRWGRWRPSAQARRLGPVAVELDRLIHREGWTPREAVACLRSRGCEQSSDQLESLVEQLPRHPSRRWIALSSEIETLVERQNADDEVELSERRGAAGKLEGVLREVLRELSAEDRRLLGLRYGSGWTVRRIATRERLEVRRLYRRFERLLRRLRRRLEAAGLDWSQVGPALSADIELDFDLVTPETRQGQAPTANASASPDRRSTGRIPRAESRPMGSRAPVCAVSR